MASSAYDHGKFYPANLSSQYAIVGNQASNFTDERTSFQDNHIFVYLHLLLGTFLPSFCQPLVFTDSHDALGSTGKRMLVVVAEGSWENRHLLRLPFSMG